VRLACFGLRAFTEMEAEILAAETETARLMSARSTASSAGGNIHRATTGRLSSVP